MYGHYSVAPHECFTPEVAASQSDEILTIDRRLTAAKRLGLWTGSALITIFGVAEAYAQQPRPVVGAAIGLSLMLTRDHFLAEHNQIRHDELEWRQINPDQHPLPLPPTE